MSDFRLLLKRRQLLSGTERASATCGKKSTVVGFECKVPMIEEFIPSYNTPTRNSSPPTVERLGQQGVSDSEVCKGSELEEDSQHANNANNRCIYEKLNLETTRPSDLIFSAGTVRNKYRDIRKKEEILTSKKHQRAMKMHVRAVHEKKGHCIEQKRTKTRKNKFNKANIKRSELSGPNCIDGDDNFSFVNDSHQLSLKSELASSLSAEESQLVLESIINKSMKCESATSVMNEYFEAGKRILSGKEKNITYADHDSCETGETIESVVIAEKIPNMSYPMDTCIIDDLDYTKYCTNAVFKGTIQMEAKRALQQRRHVLLRASLKPLSASNDQPSIERLSDCKQVLKSVFMSCISFSGEQIVPETTEVRTVKRRQAKQGAAEIILKGIDVEMLISPKC